MSFNSNDGSFWVAAIALIGSAVGMFYGPVISTQVQAEQIAVMKRDIEVLKDHNLSVIQALARIEGKLNVNKP